MLYNSRKNILKRIEEKFGMIPTKFEKEQAKERLDCIKLYHNEMEESDVYADQKLHEVHPIRDNHADIDEVTWDDLQMDEVFLRINHTGSYAGEQVLYHRLHCRNMASSLWTDFERQIRFYTENPEERIIIQENLVRIGKKKEDYYLPTFLMNAGLWNIKNGTLLHTLQILLIVCVVGTIVTGQAFFTAALIVVAITNLVIYMTMKQKYEVFLYSLGSLKQLLQFCRMMADDKYRQNLSVSEEIIQITEEMKGLSGRIIGWQGRKYAAVSGDMMYLLQDYLFGITLLDISMFHNIMKMIDQKQEQIMKLFEFAGGIDMGISIASFRMSLPFYCEPEIWNKQEICVRELVHPLIEDAVGNDFTLESGALITGANASGKSTFMKALAINTILAQTIHTSTARQFSLPAMCVMTSMSLRDDVLAGESYYVREAKRIRRMIEQTDNKQPLLLVIDEILKGTNASERLAASAAILEYLAGKSCFVVAATHDMDLADDMKSKYDNYYFESIVTDSDILFEYHIHRGKGGNSNAVELLSLLGYPQEIIAAAKQKVNLYENQ